VGCGQAGVYLTFGYVREGREDGSGRLVGTWWWLPHLALMGMAVVAAGGVVW